MIREQCGQGCPNWKYDECWFPLMHPVHMEFCEGIIACVKGKTRDDCPYSDKMKTQWYAGFTHCECMLQDDTVESEIDEEATDDQAKAE